MKHGIYYFQHKRQQKLKYVGRSHHVYEALITMYHRLFELPDRSLSPLEVELKYYHPDASEWDVRVSTAPGGWMSGSKGGGRCGARGVGVFMTSSCLTDSLHAPPPPLHLVSAAFTHQPWKVASFDPVLMLLSVQ